MFRYPLKRGNSTHNQNHYYVLMGAFESGVLESIFDILEFKRTTPLCLG